MRTIRSRDKSKWRPTRNRRRHTPIPFLAEHIAAFNKGKMPKSELADILAGVADRVYAASERA